MVEPKKCVIIGDGYVGKTFLLHKMNKVECNEFTETEPTIVDHVIISKGSNRINFADTSGQEQYEAIRSTEYTDSDIFIICFSVDNWTSFRNVSDIWLSDLRKAGFSKENRVILVGTKSDLRYDPQTIEYMENHQRRFISEKEAKVFAAAEKEIIEYIECSALKESNVATILNKAFGMCFKIKKPQKKTTNASKVTADVFNRLCKCCRKRK